MTDIFMFLFIIDRCMCIYTFTLLNLIKTFKSLLYTSWEKEQLKAIYHLNRRYTIRFEKFRVQKMHFLEIRKVFKKILGLLELCMVSEGLSNNVFVVVEFVQWIWVFPSHYFWLSYFFFIFFCTFIVHSWFNISYVFDQNRKFLPLLNNYIWNGNYGIISFNLYEGSGISLSLTLIIINFFYVMGIIIDKRFKSPVLNVFFLGI